MDDQFRKLVKELGHAINDSLADSERISEVMSRIRAAGYDLFLVLEVTVGFNRRSSSALISDQEQSQDASGEAEFRFTNQDTQFLRALRTSIDAEAPDPRHKSE